MKNKYLLGLVTGIVLLISTMILSVLINAVFPYLNEEYEAPGFRPFDDPIMALFFVYPIVLGIILTYLWIKTRKSWKSGLEYGVAFGILLSVPMFIVNFSSFTFSLLMVGSWTIVGFLNPLIAGVLLEKLDK
ncbi:hypothetical protein KKE92_05850 [Candidatus Micrarchaeota archaeon]|nr:hypothetical protein [Candidatus Micrarchaeota archaeon]MBU1681893.1 hypothetical protein [Candidatus Micrarchaeota archaeon]